MDIALTIIFLTIIAMFVVAGFDKIIEHEANTKKLLTKLGGSPTNASILIWLTALLEIIAPLVILWWLITGTGAVAAISAALALAIFTVIVTIMFYGSFNPANKWPFWSNVTTTGALLLIADTIYNY